MLSSSPRFHADASCRCLCPCPLPCPWGSRPQNLRLLGWGPAGHSPVGYEPGFLLCSGRWNRRSYPGHEIDVHTRRYIYIYRDIYVYICMLYINIHIYIYIYLFIYSFIYTACTKHQPWLPLEATSLEIQSLYNDQQKRLKATGLVLPSPAPLRSLEIKLVIALEDH